MNAPIDQLQPERFALSKAAQEHSANIGDVMLLEQLCRAAVAYTEKRAKVRGGAAAPPRPTASNFRGDPGRYQVPFGRNQGEYLDDVPSGDLVWLRDAIEQSIEDPEKARFKRKNIELRDAIVAVLTDRGDA